MKWRDSLGLCLLLLTASGCGAAGRASLPVESAPDTVRAAGDAAAAGSGGMLTSSEAVSLSHLRALPGQSATGAVRAEIEASSPVNYTSYEPDSRRFIIEIPNVDASALPGEVKLGDVAVAHVTAVPSHNGGSHARIEFTSQMDMEAKVTPSGSVLTVSLEPLPAPGLVTAVGDQIVPLPDAQTMAPAPMKGADVAKISPAPAVSQKTAARPNAATLSAPASAVSGIVLEGTGPTASVAIVGDGEFKHNAFELKNPPRLVVDLMNVSNRVAEKSFDVAAPPLQRVRVAQFRTQPEKVVRVVFDLTGSVAHAVESDGDGLRVYLGESAETLAASQRARAKEAVASVAPAVAPASVQAAAVAPARMDPPATIGADPVLGEPVGVKKVPAAALAQAKPADAPALYPPLPEMKQRPIPSSAMDLAAKDVVLFDRAEPDAKPDVATLLPPGTTFQSQTIAGEKRRYRGEKISVTFRDADIREVFFFFSDVMKMNIVLDPDVSGRIDIRLAQVPWDQAFQVILKNQGLDAVEEDNVIRIAKTAKLRSEAAERRALKQAQEQEVDPITFTRQLSYAKAIEALQVMNQVKSERGKLIADIRTNTIIIQDVPQKREAYENLLTALDMQTPQVSIEARIVEAIRSFERSLGIDWNFTGLATPALGTQTNLQFPHRAEFQADVNLASTSQAGTVGIMLGNVLDSVTLDVQLDAFEADGKVRILSSPKVMTQNNQPATIEQGVQIPIVTTTATEIEVQYVPASLRLIVTPQITAEQTVIMKVLVENNQPSATVSVGDTPGIVTERVDTQILVRSGTTAVIGGVYKLQETDNETGIPGLRKIPFFGWLFKNKEYKKDSSELIVFLTPKIVSNI